MHQVSEADREFVRRFEACECDTSEFDHRGHVRLAYAYLTDRDTEAGAGAMRRSLVRFLEHQGIPPSRYHETMTRAWILAVHHFMRRAEPAASADEFIAANPQLLDSKIMLTHYSADLLFSDRARNEFVEPDLTPIPRYEDRQHAEYLENNRDLWDAWARLHSRSAFYDVDAFRAGGSTLKTPELEAVGSARDRELLHLQCHFGLDTLSWSRLGARATGVDFSPQAIELARQLADDLNIEAAFHCADVTSLPPDWTERFDIVFSSYGVLPWLPDLTRWAREIGRVLRPGGSFHLVEFHPLTSVLDDDGRTLRHAYFHSAAPEQYSIRGSYADRDAPLTHDAYEWAHSLADVFTALLGAGLVIRGFREYAYSPYGCFDYLEQVAEDCWKVRGAESDLPLVYSIHATR